MISLLNYTGCYSSRSFSQDNLSTEDFRGQVGVVVIIMNDEERIAVDEGFYEVFDDTLYANGINKSNVSVFGQPIDVKIALADIKYVEIEKPDDIATAGCLISLTGLALLIILSIAAVSSFDSSPRSCEVGK
jgi:hypothetical protein